jgi:hypothetical protein
MTTVVSLGRTARDLGAVADGSKAHTISQRIRTLKKIPPELLPLGVVIGCVRFCDEKLWADSGTHSFALFAACFAMGKKLFTDKTLRLHKSEKKH